MSDNIKCPKCDTLIPLTETLQHQLKEPIRKEYEIKLAKQQHSLLEQEKVLVQKQKSLENEKKNFEERFQKSLKDELEIKKKILTKKATKEAQEKVSLEIKDLRDNLKATQTRLKAANKKELEILKQKQKLAEEKENIELEVARKMDKAKKQIESSIKNRLSHDHKMKSAEKDKQISDLKKSIEDLKRQAEQGSQQTQGEVQELELKKDLSQRFPLDNIQQVSKGIKGADVIQKVLNKNGKICGTIIWESKRTKNWSDTWVPKLKKDRQKIKADVAIIVTQTLPKNIKNFGLFNGIWVTNYFNFLNLADIFRGNIIKIASTKALAEGKDQKMNILFHYLTGSEFAQKVEGIIEPILVMKQDIDKEKRSYERLWAKREKQLDSAFSNTAAMFGDFQGMFPSMKTISALSEIEAFEEFEAGVLEKKLINKKEYDEKDEDKGYEEKSEDREENKDKDESLAYESLELSENEEEGDESGK